MTIDKEKDLIKIVQKKNLDEIKYFFNKNKIDTERLNYFKETIHYFIEENGPLEIINYFIEQQQQHIYKYGNNINNNDLLYYSIECNNFEVAKLLLRNGAQLNHKNNNIIEYLIEKNKLDSKKLLFILKSVKNASVITLKALVYLIKEYELLEIIFKYKFYDINFIVNIIILGKNKIALSDKELLDYLYNCNKAVIKVKEKISRSLTNSYIDDFFVYFISFCGIDNIGKYLKLIFNYADNYTFVLNLNYVKNEFEYIPFNSVNGNIKNIKIFIEYADKNNIIVDLNTNIKGKYTPFYTSLMRNDKKNNEIIKFLVDYSERKNFLLDLNYTKDDDNNKIITYIVRRKNVELFILIINYAIKHNIIIRIFRYDMYCIKENFEILKIYNEYKHIFEYID
ncbi:hypothetical protein BCR32DRAFT_250178 [Anaeromyces robustus]|uniref:Uncharacterized protein n=1 Tax=Anaeromyces robustus TaxID=1754192 RepID=A0A1Y1WAD8_9FUNG|nr:hypothetical protein BCR32DRAFT_250178 [Anaeromyces robustus]|eukprot:ORX70412.1 hypothetical protein BCR32DRAFT_250178 [Anaeromyces robustus]